MRNCKHIKANGTLCESPALRNDEYCYFHLAARDRIRRQAAAAVSKRILQLPVLEDQQTIQLALGDVANALLADRIDARKAGLIFYALQTASHNASRILFRIHSTDKYSAEFVPEPDNSLDPPPPPPPAPAPARPAPKMPPYSAHDRALAAILRVADKRA